MNNPTRQQKRHLERVIKKDSVGDARQVTGQQLLEHGVTKIQQMKLGKVELVDVVADKFYLIPNPKK